MSVANIDSDVSTDVQTDGSTCSESGLKTPTNFDDYCLPEPFDLAEFKVSSSAAHGWAWDVPTQKAWCPPPPAFESSSVVPRLNSKACAFKPQTLSEAPAREHYNWKRAFVEAITCAKKALKASEHVANVEISEDGDGWSIVIQPHAQGENADWQTECLLKLAKDVLLEAASKSKNIYLLGYCSPKPFTMQPQGFEATLAAMESPVSACWHVFKKGFCRHGDQCSKSHPACEVPVRVLVESVEFNCSTSFLSVFKQEVANLTMAVIATLGECAYTDKVEAFKDKDCKGWTIEVVTKPDMMIHKDYLLTLAKSALFSSTDNSNSVYIMGYAAKPFMVKSQGFVTLLGDMQDESVACWDLYSKGVCKHDCACRWRHPECLVPINLVVKENPFPALSY